MLTAKQTPSFLQQNILAAENVHVVKLEIIWIISAGWGSILSQDFGLH